jgi:uncharacterized repeat protein (TIGR01451 family)
MSTSKKTYILRVFLSVLLATTVLLVMPVPAAHADTLIDTTPSWDGGLGIGSFGIPAYATIGQVITVPANDVILDSFTFYPDLPATLAFQGEVYAWDGTMASGPNLFESVPMATAGTGYEAVTFDTGGVRLQAGQQYVLFVSCSRLFDGHTGTGFLGYTSADAYGGGSVFFLNNGSDTSAWTISTWIPDAFGGDLAFQAHFISPLDITKTVTPTLAAPGETITYTLSFTNYSTTLASGVVLTDVIPYSVTVQSVISSGVAITDTGAVPPHVWEVADVAPGEGGAITITAVIDSDLARGTFTNTAILTGSLGVDYSSAPVTVYHPPPTVDILSVLPSGPDLAAQVEIHDPQGDPLSGSVEVRADAGVPITVTFETLSMHCGFGGANPLELRLNGGLIGQTFAPGSCTCTPGVGSVDFTGPEIAANFIPRADNTWGFDQPLAGEPYTAWARADIQYGDGTAQQTCLFDYGGGDCDATDVCAAGLPLGPHTGSSVLPPVYGTTVVSDTYANSLLPPFLDVSGLMADSYVLHVTTTDGFDSAEDAELFGLDDESLLLINPNDVQLRKTVEPTVAAPGSPITYTLVFSAGGNVANGLLITDAVPISVTNPSYVYSGPALTETGSVSYAWQLPHLGLGQGGVITITGHLSDTLPHGHVFTNTATITGMEFDLDTGNNVADAAITIDAEAPDPPSLLSPADGTITSTTAFTLTWLASPSADVAGYLVDWNDTEIDVGNTTVFGTEILADAVYSWTVSAYDTVGNQGVYTDVWSFEVDTTAPDPPVLIAPADGTVTYTKELTLTWSPSVSPDVAGYLLLWNGSEVAIGPATEFATGVLADGTYTWTVAAYDILSHTSDYTDVWSFEIDSAAPYVTQVSPGSEATGVALGAPLVITFSKTIVSSTLGFIMAPDPGGWSVIWSGDGMVASLDHDPFRLIQRYVATVTAAADLAGNPLAAVYPWHFTTEGYGLYLPLVLNMP